MPLTMKLGKQSRKLGEKSNNLMTKLIIQTKDKQKEEVTNTYCEIICNRTSNCSYETSKYNELCVNVQKFYSIYNKIRSPGSY